MLSGETEWGRAWEPTYLIFYVWVSWTVPPVPLCLLPVFNEGKKLRICLTLIYCYITFQSIDKGLKQNNIFFFAHEFATWAGLSGNSFLFLHSQSAGLVLRLEVGIICRLAHSHVQRRNVNCCGQWTVATLYFAKVVIALFLVPHAFPGPWHLLIKKWGLYSFPSILGRIGNALTIQVWQKSCQPWL